jgi:hypothetical protein
MSLHSTAIINGSNRNTNSVTKPAADSEGPSAELADSVVNSVDSEGKSRGRRELGLARSWEMKSQDPPRAFFLLVGGVGFHFGWERIEIRPEQELVVK